MPPDPKIQGDVILLPDGGTAPNTPEVRKALGLVDKVKATAVAGRDALAQSAGTSATQGDKGNLQTLADGAVMVPGGFTDDWDEELRGIIGGIGAALGKPLEDPRKTAPTGYRKARDAAKLRKAVAMERSPVVGSVGYGVGALGQAAVAGPLLKGVGGGVGTLTRLATGTEKAAEGANLVRKGATAVGNVALPGAIIGAGQAESVEDIPASAGMGALIGTAAGGLAAAPGAIREGLAHPAVRKFARRAEVDSALRAAGANRTVGKQIEKNFPGGQEGFVEQQRSMGIGTGAVPTPEKALEESRAAATKVGAERKALEDQARELMIPSDEVANAVDAHAKGLAWPANDALISAYRGEAAKLRKMGRPMATPEAPPPAIPPPPFPRQDPRLPVDAVVEELGPGPRPGLPPGEPSTGIAPYQYRHRTPQLPSGDQAPVQAQAQILNPVPPAPAQAPPRNEISFPDLNDNLRGYQKRAYLAQAEKQGREAEMSRQTGSIINDILEQHANKLPEEVGTPWRQKKGLENVAIRSEDMAAAGQSGSNLGKGIKIATAVGAGGAALMNPLLAIPPLAGLAVAQPGVQMRMAQGVGAMSRAAARAPDTTLGRILSRYTPSPQTVGRIAAHGQAQEGVAAVQEAALQSEDAGISEHYKQMLTNPEYNREAMGEE